MKPHLIIKLAPGARAPQAPDDPPHWADVVGHAWPAASALSPTIDAELRRYVPGALVTREHSPAGQSWSSEEIASGLDRIYRIVLRRNASVPADLIAAVRLIPEVERVEAGRIASGELPTAQALAPRRRTGQETRDAIRLPLAHARTQGEREIKVAVLDTGVDVDHEEFRDRVETGYDFVDILDAAAPFIGDHLGADPDPDDDVGHGTHVAGIIVGRGARMPTGVAPRCTLLPVRVLAAMKQGGRRVGAGLIDNINVGTKWAVDQGADVINMSLGVRHTGGGLPHAEVIDYAARKGVSVIAASGNDGSDERYYPGALDHVIAVGAIEDDGHVASFSTYGPQVDLVAPGRDVYSTSIGGGYAFSTGTSHAAPFVTGAVALLKSYASKRGRRLGDRKVKHLLKHTSDRIDQRNKNRKAGYGRLNAADALELLEHELR